jgi:hypothetical protein
MCFVVIMEKLIINGGGINLISYYVKECICSIVNVEDLITTEVWHYLIVLLCQRVCVLLLM